MDRELAQAVDQLTEAKAEVAALEARLDALHLANGMPQEQRTMEEANVIVNLEAARRKRDHARKQIEDLTEPQERIR